MKTTLKIFALTATLFGFATISFAQNTATETAADVGAKIITPITLTETQDLYFGNIVAQTAEFDVKVTPAGVISGAATYGEASHRVGEFEVTGEVGASYHITLPNNGEVTITGAGTAMAVKDFASSKTANKSTLSTTNGEDIFTVGATLVVNGNQASGGYTGIWRIYRNL